MFSEDLGRDASNTRRCEAVPGRRYPTIVEPCNTYIYPGRAEFHWRPWIVVEEVWIMNIVGCDRNDGSIHRREAWDWRVVRGRYDHDVAKTCLVHQLMQQREVVLFGGAQA